MKIKQIFKSWRIMFLLALLVMFVFFLHPDPYNQGVAIRSVASNSSASIAGMFNPPTSKPMLREVIFEVNGKAVRNVQEYIQATTGLEPNEVLTIKTRTSYTRSGDETKFSFIKQEMKYTLTVKPLYERIILDEKENVTVEKMVTVNETINGTVVPVNKTVNETVTRNKIQKNIIGSEALGLTVYDAPTSNIKKGLDLEGGTRVLLEPEEEVSDEDLDFIIDNLQRRLNLFGLSDIQLRKQSDLLGHKFILIEVAGANEDEVKKLISSQGKFEANIGNNTVFRGGDDIKNVCRTPDCAFAVDPRKPCGVQADGSHVCRFSFSIALSTEAAQRQADLTKNLDVISENDNDYLSEDLRLYLDDELVDTLKIGADLRGSAVTSIAISGSGSGETQADAAQDSATNMKRLQTVLMTGSLPVKLKIAKLDTVSPTLGNEFVRNILLVGLLALLAVSAVVVTRYRDLKIAIPMLITMLSEVVLMLGLAATINWNLDLAAIAGILIAVGTGVDDQIVIIDEIKQHATVKMFTWKEKIARAFFIIMAAYFTTVVAMLPLWWAGAGLIRGFAITTIAGVTLGVLVTRPAFAAIMEMIVND